MCFDFVYNFEEFSLTYKTIESFLHMHMVLHTKYAMFLSDQPFIISTYFHKSTNIKFHVNPFSGRWVVLWGQRHGRTDWQKDDEANGCFSQFWTHTWPSYL